MISIENVQVVGWEAALRGMRNPLNSWDRADSQFSKSGEADIGCNDKMLAEKLAAGGSVHAKYRRMIVVYADITAPLYWWKEADTYKVGTVANSCSTMHKIHAKKFELEDFSFEHLFFHATAEDEYMDSGELLQCTIQVLNYYRKKYLETKDKAYWWQMIQLLPSSYNQRRTVMLNYEALAGMYRSRKDHKLDEWRNFCLWVENLPYAELITVTGGRDNV